MDFRSPVVFLAPLLGLILACLGWLVVGGSARVLAPLEVAEGRLAVLPVIRPPSGAAGPSGADGKPLFVSAPAASLRLEGVSRTPRRVAALVSVNGEAAQWVTIGSAVGGYTLSNVSATGIVVENVDGAKSLLLGESLGTPVTPTAAGPQQGPPPGMRQGLEPASAPAAR